MCAYMVGVVRYVHNELCTYSMCVHVSNINVKKMKNLNVPTRSSSLITVCCSKLSLQAMNTQMHAHIHFLMFYLVICLKFIMS